MSLPNIRCDAAQTRRLMDSSGAGNVKNVDIDKIDNCSEVTLGLLTTIFVTALIWALCLPFFDIAGMSWIRSWETKSGKVSMHEFKQNIYMSYPADSDGVPMGAYQAMDENHDGMVVEPELQAFLGRLQTPMNSTEQVDYVFQGLDTDQDHILSSQEWTTGLSQSDFYGTTTTTTQTPAYQAVPSPTPAEPAPEQRAQGSSYSNTAPPSVPISEPAAKLEATDAVTMEQLIDRMGDAGKGTATHALHAFDLDKDGFAAHGEFLKGLKQLPEPIEGPLAEGVFQALDLNQDSVVESQEFFKAFNAKHYVNAAPVQITTTPAPNPLKVKALQVLGLDSPPLTMARLTHSMGAVSPAEAYSRLDANQNGEISEEEMVSGGKADMPPLTEIESKYAHRGLDINGDDKVVPAEMYDAVKFGHFFPTMAQAQAAHAV